MDQVERETLRTKFFKESLEMNQKQRFGLFSQPGSIAIGETNMFVPKKGTLSVIDCSC